MNKIGSRCGFRCDLRWRWGDDSSVRIKSHRKPCWHFFPSFIQIKRKLSRIIGWHQTHEIEYVLFCKENVYLICNCYFLINENAKNCSRYILNMVDTKNKWNYIKDREEIKTLMRLSFRFVESSNFFYFCVSPLMILERRAFLPS